MAWEVNLQNPAWLAAVIDRYLSMGVAPVDGTPPPLLTEGTVQLVLPDASTYETTGRVIRASGPGAFLVQLDKAPDLDVLRRMTKTSKVTGRVTPEQTVATGVPSSTSLVDDLLSTVSPEHRVFDVGEEPAPRRPSKPVSVGDLLEQSVETAPRAGTRDSSPSLAVPPAPPESRQTAEWAAPPAAVPSVPRTSTGQIPIMSDEVLKAYEASGRLPFSVEPGAQAGTPGSVRDAPKVPREGTSSGAVKPPPVVTGLETEYSDVYAKVKDLPLGEKQKLARHGRRTVRQILMRDNNKTLQRMVLSNPDIMLDEVLEYANWPGLAKDALEYISQNTTWMSSRMVLLALVKNPSSPIEMAIRLVPRLGPGEWRLLVRPNVVRNPVAAAARKCLRTDTE